jgi:flavin reductase (DIM6/NTAB) family NADH-FMN oxidoreductase RutF
MFIDMIENISLKRGIFSAIIAPRPIGWISTLNEDGTANLAPFSYFNLVSNSPAILMFSCNTPEDRAEKDTLANVRRTGEFVFNLVSADLVEVMNQTSNPLPVGQDEFVFAGIEKAASVCVGPPRVAASPCNLECTVMNILPLGGEGPLETLTHAVFGRVVGMHVQDDYITSDGYFDTDRARPMARLGGAVYGEIGRTFELKRQFRRAGEESY